jgi:uncharacterized membrane protein
MDASPAKARRWMTWALVASLGLNLAFLGLAAGAFLKGPRPHYVTGPALAQYARAQPRPYQQDLRRALRASRGDWSGPREALRAQRGALADALVAEPFDPETVLAILEREGALADDLASRGARLLMAQIGRMSAEDRAAYAEALRAKRRGG